MDRLGRPLAVARRLGWPVVSTAFAVLLCLVALTQPIWTFQGDQGGGDVDKFAYGWTSRVEDEWRNGVFASTTVTPYSSPTFDEFRMRDIAGTSYLLGATYVLLLFFVAAVQRYPLRFPPIAGRFAGVLALLAAGATLIYPAANVGPAAALDVNSAVAGLSGSAIVAGERLAWGPGAAWWLWAASVVFVLAGLALPFLQGRTVRRPAPRPPA